MILSVLRNALMPRATLAATAIESDLRIGSRKVLLPALLLSAFVAMNPTSALAWCCPSDTCVPTCDPPTLACEAVDVATSFALLYTEFDLYLFLVTEPEIVDAVSGVQTQITAATQVQMDVNINAAKLSAQDGMFWDQAAAQAKIDVSQMVNTASQQCRLDTVKQTAKLAEPFRRQMIDTLHKNSANLAMNSSYTTGRMLAAATQRYCKNGMLSPDLVGPKAFAAMGCFQDPPYENAYMKPGSVLDHLVLVHPDSAPLGVYADGSIITKMAILDNPDDPANPSTAAVVWASLTDKQKAYVAARRYCENLEQSELHSNHFTGDQASLPDNMQRITQNFSAMGMLGTLTNVCYSELARRTAPNVYDAADPQMASASMQLKKTVRDKKVAEQLLHIGTNPIIWQAYTAFDAVQLVPNGPPVMDGADPQIFISPALYDYAKYHVYCADADTWDSMNFDPGKDAQRFTAQIKCTQITGLAKELDARYADLFERSTAGIKAAGRSFVVPLSAPAKADNGGGLRQVSLRKETSNKTKMIPMDVVIRKMDQSETKSNAGGQ